METNEVSVGAKFGKTRSVKKRQRTGIFMYWRRGEKQDEDSNIAVHCWIIRIGKLTIFLVKEGTEHGK
eukprot:12778735-Ditylum_brightwellii.AAC.1